MFDKDINSVLLKKFKSDKEVCNNISKLRENFTAKRENIDLYLQNESLVSAYTYFYLPTNYNKFFELMKYLTPFHDELKSRPWVDVGCGPGTYIWAIQDFFNSNQALQGIDISDLMLKQANAIKDKFYSSKNISFSKKINKVENPVLLFSHSANEMSLNEVLGYIDEVDPSYILFIEPGTKSYFSKFLSIRESLVGEGYFVNYPCMSSGSCPLKEKDDWCHQYVKVRHSNEINRICQKVGINRDWMPLSLSLFSKDDLSSSESRVVRTYPETKFSFEFDCCEKSDGINKLVHLQQYKRKLSKSEQKIINKILSGASVSYNLVKELKDGTLRVNLNMEDEDE